jgi:hypothetical protein
MRNLYKFIIVFCFFITIPSFYLFAQVGINADNSTPDQSAGLDVNFNNKGFLLPRMTFDQRNAIASPAEGLMVFCTNCTENGALSIYSNSFWRSFFPCNTPSATAGTFALSPGQIVWSWTAVPGATGYKWNTTANYGTALDMGMATTQTESGISCGTTNTRYVWVNDECGISIPVTLSQMVPAGSPVSPSSGSHVPGLTTLEWNWNAVADAIGYRWNTTDNFATATEMGTSTTKIESGLSSGTYYTRFVWAYNGCGSSASTSLMQSTLLNIVCGSAFTINHLASGGIAPVDKTVTYSTVTGIPGEPAKCWITRNLGASQQATVVSDASEASAGWYFQFNRKQGYQYISSRIPGSAWISSISESSNWITANDPCASELGNGWRIPTSTEWTNVDASGNWTDWNGPYGSALKLPAAGYLYLTDGSLNYRGSYGYYWSSTQNSTTHGWSLGFLSGYCSMSSNNKALGLPTRCIRDF